MNAGGNLQDLYTDGARKGVGRFAGRYMSWMNPSAITLIGASLCVAAGVPAYLAHRSHQLLYYWLAAAVFLIGALFDVADGHVARLCGKTSELGEFLDSSVDRVGETSIIISIGLALSLDHNQLGLFAAMAAAPGSVLVSYVRAKAEKIGVDGDVGLGQRGERCTIIIAGLVLAPWLDLQWCVLLLAVTAWGTVAYRVLHVRRQLVQRDTP